MNKDNHGNKPLSGKVKVTQEDMRAICHSCADKMDKKGVKHFYLDIAKPDLGLSFEAPPAVLDGLRKFAAATGTISGVEVFSAGKWNDDTYTNADLDKIVAAFKATKDALKPYLKLGHSDAQSLLAEDELPAAGWITNVYRHGSKLLADFTDVPRKIYDLVMARAYKRLSCEIFVDVDVQGKTYPLALKAIALLGGETPAVQNLDDIHALYALDSTVLAYQKTAEVRAYSFDPAQTSQEDYSMEIHVKDGSPAAPAPIEKDNALPPAPPAAPGLLKPAIPAAGPGVSPEGDDCFKQLAAAHLELDSMKKQMAVDAPRVAESGKQAAAYRAEAETLREQLGQVRDQSNRDREELNKFKAEARKKDVVAEVAKFVQDKKILPSQAPILEGILLAAKEAGVKKFKVGDKDFDSTEALVREFVALSGNGLPTEPRTEQGKPSEVAIPGDGEAMDAAVKAYMAKTGVKSYRDAYIEVAKGSPEPKKV